MYIALFQDIGTFFLRLFIFLTFLFTSIYILIGIIQTVLRKKSGKGKIIKGVKILISISLIILVLGLLEVYIFKQKICFSITCPIQVPFEKYIPAGSDMQIVVPE